MARPSSITRLPEEVRSKIAVLRNQGRTLDEILAHLEELDVDVSRSALGRHLKKQREVTEKIQRSRQMAEAIARNFGDKETSQVARTNIELLHSMTMQLMIGGEEGEEVKLDSKDAMFLATTIEKLAKASKTDFDRELKVREEATKEAMKKASEIVDVAGKEKGLSAEVINELKSKFLGVPNE